MAEPEASTTTRRRALAAGFALAAAAAAGGPAFATSLAATPRQTPGPFYPRTLPLDSDNDLVAVDGRGGPAEGTVSHVMGHVLDPSGNPLAGMTVEIWQCDARGIYHHPRDPGRAGADPGLWPDGERRGRRIPVPPHRAGALSRSHAAHPLCGFGPGIARLHDPDVHRRAPAERARFRLARDPRGCGAAGPVGRAFRPGDEIEPGAKRANFDIVLDLGSAT